MNTMQELCRMDFLFVEETSKLLLQDAKFDVDYFISKFEAIPEEFLIAGTYTQHKQKFLFNVKGTRNFVDLELHCSMGWCNETRMNRTDESIALDNLFLSYLRVSPININDGCKEQYDNTLKLYGHHVFAHLLLAKKTPKERILLTLNYIKELQEGNITT